MVEIPKTCRAVRCLCLLPCLFFMVIAGCSSRKLLQARSDFYNGDYVHASEVLSDADAVSRRDKLLFFMEKGLILHYSGHYGESIHLLISAVKLMEDQEVISAIRQTTSLVTTEWLTEYKGEYAERLLVHTYLMMNYLLIGKHEDALVEAKQALEIYNQYPACSQDYFTRALIAHCYESLGEINDAYIEYKKLAQLMPDPRPVAGKLFVLASRLGFEDEVQEYRKYLSASELDSLLNGSSAEMVVFVSQGKSPIKIPRNIVLPPSIRFSFSAYKDSTNNFIPPDVNIATGNKTETLITTDVGEVLNASLKDRLLTILAKETARVVAKESIASNVEDPTWEILIRLSFFIMEEPDTRSWQILPAYLTIINIPLNAGKNQIYINNFLDNDGDVFFSEIDTDSSSRKYYYYSIRN